MQLALSWSGGKDSTLALERLRQDSSASGAAVEVAALVTTVTRDFGRVSMHGVRTELVRAQAAALGLPLVEVEIAAGAGNDAYEAAFAGALADLASCRGTARRAQPPSVDRAVDHGGGLRPRARHAVPLHDAVGTMAFGDLFLSDIRAYRERQMQAAGWNALFPLWGEDTAALARRFVASGYRAILVTVDPRQLDPAWVGRDLDAAALAELPAGVDPCGENGEFHTFVWDGPIFSRPVPVVRGERVARDGFWFCDLQGGEHG